MLNTARTLPSAQLGVSGRAHRVFGSALMLVLCAATFACTANPRDGATLVAESVKPITFSGYVPLQPHSLSIQVQNVNTDLWEPLVVFRFEPTSTYTDPCGGTWYGWKHDFRMPSPAGYPYWRRSQDGLSQSLTARVLLLPSGIPLASFDVGDDACLASTAQGCGTEIAKTCGDADGQITFTCPFNRIGCGS